MRLKSALVLLLSLLAGLVGGLIGVTCWVALADYGYNGSRVVLWLVRKADMAGAVVVVMTMAALCFGLVQSWLTGLRIYWAWIALGIAAASLAAILLLLTFRATGLAPRAFPAGAFWVGALTAILLRNRVVRP